jgi:hypothetical protein
MKTEKQSYYEGQLNLINFHQTYSPTFKINGGENSTKWMDLNEESAKVLIKKLKKEFNIK